jgi:hypothetical protein
MGVIAKGEPLEIFDIVEQRLDERAPNYADLDGRRQHMLARLDQKQITTDEPRTFSFIEEVEGGLRLYREIEAYEIPVPSRLRWFIVPALMFLAGAIGSGFISFRWK